MKINETEALNEAKHCELCGTELVVRYVGAESFTHVDDMGITWAYTKYSTQTGKRQLVKQYRCPKDRWYKPDNHTNFMDDKILLGEEE